MRLLSCCALLLAGASSVATIAAPLIERSTKWCGSFGSTSAGPYTIFHNNFGASTGSGSQCTTFNSESSNIVSWSTSWSWSGGEGHVKSYSNVALQSINKNLNSISSIPSSWSWGYTGSNLIADVSYDLWLAPSVGANDEYEIMVWLAALGGALPISTSSAPVATTSIAGKTWNLYSGPNGDTTVFSFVATENISSWSGDMKLFFNYLVSTNRVSSNMVVSHLQAGTEPFDGSNAVFTTSSYSMSVN